MLIRRLWFAALAFLVIVSQNATAQKKADPKAAPAATPADALAVLPDFQIELLHSASGEGSWICMAKDSKGRLIISGQQGHPMLRVTLKDGKANIEKLNLPIKISGAMGMLDAFGSLYVNGIGPQGFGLYRFRDTKGTDQYDEVQFLKKFDGSGEHGPHGLALGPDNKIYVMNGNHTALPEGLAPNKLLTNYREDFVLPRQWDGNGHAAGILAPGGYVVRTDADGKTWELVLGGFRNAYDIAFNPDGELFTFDSDMEWDWGMPWYRPIRVNHCVSGGGEYGWRSGTGVWPEKYIDSLGTVVDVGVGSPTGVSNGIGAKFPEKYQKAMYMLDWTYGRILATHLKPNGAGYTATTENFVAPKGMLDKSVPKKNLNVTDAVIGDDGAMYFTTGGRNTQSGLYRIRYVGKEPTDVKDLVNKEGFAERKQRRELEAFHGKVDPSAIDKAWPFLSSKDRNLQYAARLAIESQPVAEWQQRALSEKNPDGAFAALVALARYGDAKTQDALLASLDQFPLAKLDDKQKLDKLRTLELTFIRQGQPSFERTKKLLGELEDAFPGKNEEINREVVQLLVYLRSQKVLDKALAHMKAVPTQEDQIHYVFHLRTLPIGFWSLDQRREYLSYFKKDHKFPGHPKELNDWFARAGRGYSHGSSYNNFWKNFLKDAVANMSEQERKALAPEIKSIDEKTAAIVFDVKPRKTVQAWKMDDVLARLPDVDSGRDFKKGQEAFLAAQCIKCHRMGDQGGGVGPDLTAVISRFSRRDILESILEPSKVISEQYENVNIETKNGKIVTGRLVDQRDGKIVIQPDPLSGERVEIPMNAIESRSASKISPMPANLVDVLTIDEILDLIAYLEASGQRQHRAFTAKKK